MSMYLSIHSNSFIYIHVFIPVIIGQEIADKMFDRVCR